MTYQLRAEVVGEVVAAFECGSVMKVLNRKGGGGGLKGMNEELLRKERLFYPKLPFE